MYSSSVSSKYSEPLLSSHDSSSLCVPLSEVASVDDIDGMESLLPKSFQRKQQVVTKEHRIPTAKRMKYAACRRAATGRGTLATSPTATWGGMLEEIEDKVQASEVQGAVGFSFLGAWEYFVSAL